jgi:hypothetical protein
MIEILSVKNRPCDLEVKQQDKEVFAVKVKGDPKEKHLCWACLRRIAMLQLRENGKAVSN